VDRLTRWLWEQWGDVAAAGVALVALVAGMRLLGV
jgi:hypothetical protein